MLKPHALLINTARGGLFDMKQVEAWIEDHPHAGVALDMFEQEPPSSLPLHGDRVILTSHIAGLPKQFIEEATRMTTEAILLIMQRRLPAHLVGDSGQ